MTDTRSEFQVLPRIVRRITPLIHQGQSSATIVYPGSDAAYRPLADSLAQALAKAYGCQPDVQADTDLMPTRSAPLPETYRHHSLIFLGNLNTNRAVLPLYARYYCAADATYPGGDGCELRTIVNPYGTGWNVILAGGSSFAGVSRAVERLMSRIAEAAMNGDSHLPFLLEVDLDPALSRALAEWPEAPLNADMPSLSRKTHALSEDVMKTIGAYGIMYAWTGDPRYGEFAADHLKALNAQRADSYGDWHYRAERMLRVLPWLTAGGFLSEADIERTDQLMLGTALGTQDMWWRMTHGRPPLGHRHHGRGTFEFLLMARYLKEQANPNEALREQCVRWIAECQAYLDGLGRAGVDDQDDESGLTNLATVFWYALAEERFDFFEGSAHRVAERAIALHDNMGAGAGYGGYGEGLPGTMYLQQEATVPIAACAFYEQDSRLKWILERMPHLKSPLISGFLHYSPLFMHMFHTGAELPSVPPDDLTGVHWLPLASHQYEISTHPPEHVEEAGHSVNAPETWLRGEGIGLNTLPAESGFDKIVFRGGFTPEDAYLLLQGYQGGFRWQGHMQAANCIVRFSQAGHIFLIQNTYRHSHYQKNGLFVSDGFNNTPLPPIAERIAAADFASIGLTATRLSDFHHSDWTRHIFWSKKGDGLFVVLDKVTFQADGPYSVTCTWRTPGYARLNGRCWSARQGKHRFALQWSEPLQVTSEEETDQGGAVPFVLRQTKGGEFKAGDDLSFQNLFYVRPADSSAGFDLHRLDSQQALITDDGKPFAWCGIADSSGEIHALNMTLQALSAWVSAEEIALSGLTRLTIGDWHMESDKPINFCLELTSGLAIFRYEGDPNEFATLTFTVQGEPFDTETNKTGLMLYQPPDDVRKLATLLRKALSTLQPSTESPVTAEATEESDWHPAWSFDRGTPVLRRIRNLIVEASPPPLDGFNEQLVDTVVAEIRQTRQQWPAADGYEITLTLPEAPEVDHMRIVGDSTIDPTLRVFRPLPEGISVTISGDSQDVRSFPVEPESGLLRYKLFRDIEDQFETREVRIGGQPAAQIRVHVPAPAPGNPLVLHEIEVYSAERVSPPAQFLTAADLRGDGRQTVLLVNAANELLALSEDGDELWRQRLPAAATHLSVHDLSGRGRLSVCLGLLGGELRIFSADGALERSIPLAQMFQQRSDAYFGRVYTIHALNVWHREPDGRAALVVGGYSAICFLDADYEIAGHSWADGSWQNDILVAPNPHPPAPSPSGGRGEKPLALRERGWGEGSQMRSQDLWVRNGWNHGIGVYAGQPGMTPSGETITFGGISQPMFRSLRKVIPFVNGRTAAFEWLPGSEHILAAAENGVGVLSTLQRDWLWKIEGGTPITACVSAGNEIIVGGADGFIAAYAALDGRPLRRMRTDAPVTGLAALDSGRLAVATRRGLLILDAEWKFQKQYPLPVRRLLQLNGEKLVIVREDGVLELLVCDKEIRK